MQPRRMPLLSPLSAEAAPWHVAPARVGNATAADGASVKTIARRPALRQDFAWRWQRPKVGPGRVLAAFMLGREGLQSAAGIRKLTGKLPVSRRTSAHSGIRFSGWQGVVMR